LGRLNPFIEEIFGDYQCGFRREKPTVDHIFGLRQIKAKYYEFYKELRLVFIDYKQTYDSIDRK